MHLKLRHLLFSIPILLLAACKKTEDFSSRISFVNAAISNPAITLKADSLPIVSNIKYDSLINSIVPSGTFGISLFANNVFQQAASFTTNLEAGQSYISMVYEDTNSKSGFFIRKDALPGTPPEGQCSIRIFNVVARTSNLYLANDTAKKRQLIGSLSFGNFLTSQAFSTIDTIPKASIRFDSSKAVDTLRQPLRSGKIYTLYLIGRLGDTLPSMRKPKVIVQVHN